MIQPKDFSDLPAALEGAAIDLAFALAMNRPVLLLGAPGLAKTMLAGRAPLLLSLDDHAKTWIRAELEGLGYETAGHRVERAPFRAPHFTCSEAALIGGLVPSEGAFACTDIVGLRTSCRCKRALPAHDFHNVPRAVVARAGELHLARFGVLLIDELDEWRLSTLGNARRALAEMHGRPHLIATATECPCGFRDSGVPGKECKCSDVSVARHRERTWSAMNALGLDAAKVRVPSVSLDEMRGGPRCKSTDEIRTIAIRKAVGL